MVRSWGVCDVKNWVVCLPHVPAVRAAHPGFRRAAARRCAEALAAQHVRGAVLVRLGVSELRSMGIVYGDAVELADIVAELHDERQAGEHKREGEQRSSSSSSNDITVAAS